MTPPLQNGKTLDVMEGFDLVIYVRSLIMLDAGNDAVSTQVVFYLRHSIFG
jgi:hypothetical protein